MHNMCAEHVATENGTDLLWHAVDSNGNALCARIFSAAPAPDGASHREDYCRTCMNAVGNAVRPVGNPRTPAVGSDPHGQ